MKTTFSLWVVLFMLTACSSTWVISQRPDGGTIGYHGYHTQAEAKKDFEKLIPCAQNYSILSDDLRSKDYIYTQLEPVTSDSSTYGSINGSHFHEATTSTNYIPTTNSGTKHWHEVQYSCSPAKGAASAVPATTALSTEACRNLCTNLANSGKLNAGISIDECSAQACKK